MCLPCFVLWCLGTLSSPKSTSGTLPGLSGSSQIAFPLISDVLISLVVFKKKKSQNNTKEERESKAASFSILQGAVSHPRTGFGTIFVSPSWPQVAEIRGIQFFGFYSTSYTTETQLWHSAA